MGFLIKTAFWLTIVILLLPIPEDQQNASGPMISASDAISVLSTALNDARGFCTRNPDACVTSAAAVQTFGTRAQYASKMLHDFITDKLDETRNLTPPPGSRAQPQADPAHPAVRNIRAGQDTLNPQDLEPAWREPRPASQRRI